MKPDRKSQYKQRGDWRIKTALLHILSDLLIFWFVFGLLVGIELAADDSMEPSIRPGDLVIYERHPTALNRGDVVIACKGRCRLTGRITGTGGQTINVTEANTVTVDGKLLTDMDNDKTEAVEDGMILPAVLGDREYFLLCDARQTANDSRSYGAIMRDQIIGKVILVIRRRNV